MTQPVLFREFSANLGRGVSVPRFEDNVEALVVRAEGAFICFQEIDEADLPDERSIVGKALRSTHSFAGARTKVMIAVPNTYRRKRERVITACSGYAGVTPERKIVSVIVKRKRALRLPRFAVVNTHFPYANPKHTEEQQRQARIRHAQVRARLEEEVRYLADVRGITVFINADTNDPDMQPPHPDARLLVGANGIDKMWVVVRSVKITRVTKGTVDLTIDGHNAHVVRGYLSRAA